MQKTIKKNIDIGLAIREKMNEQGTTIAWLARQVGCNRGNLHKQLQNKHIYPELLLKISIALQTDFFAHYSYCFSQIAIEDKNLRCKNSINWCNDYIVIFV